MFVNRWCSVLGLSRCHLLARCLLLAVLLNWGAAQVASAATSTEPFNRPAPSVAQPQRALLNGIARAGQRLVAVGEHGLVIWSDDNGQAWHQAAVPVDVNLTTVAFVDEHHGWATGHQGVVLSSENGGESWRKRLDGVQAAALTLARAKKKAAALEEDAREDYLYAAQRLVDDGPDKPLLALLFNGPNRISVVGAFNLALHSRDGGKTWQAFYDQIDNPDGLHLYALQALGPRRFIAGEQGLLLATDPGGGSFKRLASPYEGSYFGLLPLANNRLLLFGLRANVFRSDDGGQQWHPVTIEGAKASFNAGQQLSDGSIVLLDQGGRVYTSRDQGRSFKAIPFGWGAPLTAVAEATDGSLVLTSLAGIVILPREKLAGPTLVVQESKP